MSNVKALADLAQACHAGACNPRALIRALPEAVACIPGRCDESLELKYILGHINFLLGESLGPTPETVKAYSEKIEQHA